VTNVETGTRRTIENVGSVHVIDSLLPNTLYEVTSVYVVAGVLGSASSPTSFRTRFTGILNIELCFDFQ